MFRKTRRCGQLVMVSTDAGAMPAFRQCTGLTDTQLLCAAGVRPGQAVEIEVRVVTPAPAAAAGARRRPRRRAPAGRPSRASEQRQECAEAIRAELAAGARTRAELRASVPYPSWTVDIALSQLRRAGVAERVTRGVYRLAEGDDDTSV